MRFIQRCTAIVGVVALGSVAVAPAFAAAPVAQSGANAIHLSVAGNGNGSGTVQAENDGSGERKTGNTSPPVSVLKQQHLLNAGVLAQDATARNSGVTAACAGVAGNGGSVAQIGDSRCLTPGEPVGLNLGANLDLSSMLVLDPDGDLAPIAEQLNPLAQEIFRNLTPELATAIEETPLGGTGLSGTFGAVESQCTAGPDGAAGDATLTDSRLLLDVAGEKVTLVDLPTHPKPNTHVPVNLDAATQAIVDAVKAQVTSMLAPPGGAGPFAPLGEAAQQVQDEAIAKVVAETREQLLEPLQDNVIDLVLNKQTRSGPGNIKVSAIDLSVLPVAEAELGAPLVQAQIANVACAAGEPRPEAGPAPRPSGLPTAVTAGYGGEPGAASGGSNDPVSSVVLGSLAVMATAGLALVTWRRLQHR